MKLLSEQGSAPEGAVEVIRDGIQIARVSDRGAVFGELAVLLDKPHTADVRAIERAEFHVADATTLLNENPTALLYVAAILARRLDGANAALLDVKRQLEHRQTSQYDCEIGGECGAFAQFGRGRSPLCWVSL
jgi:CRP-like cAMP-binding protein